MLYRFPIFLKTFIAVTGLALNLLLLAFPIAFWGMLKVIPLAPWQKLCTALSHLFYRLYIKANTLIINLTSNPKWDIKITQPLTEKSWNLVICNHRSWLDIMVLMHVLGQHLPPPKFFLKRSLLYVPIIGIASWALDMIFVHRYSRQLLRKKPHLKGKSLENAKRSCEKFRNRPTTIVNFVEGTRLTEEKHARSKSPYKNLLKPNAAGIAFTLAAMGEQFENLIDVTLDYPETDINSPIFKQVLTGQVKHIKAHVKVTPIDPELIGDYFGSKPFRVGFQKRLNQIWQEKDERLAKMQSQYQTLTTEDKLEPAKSDSH